MPAANHDLCGQCAQHHRQPLCRHGRHDRHEATHRVCDARMARSPGGLPSRLTTKLMTNDVPPYNSTTCPPQQITTPWMRTCDTRYTWKRDPINSRYTDVNQLHARFHTTMNASTHGATNRESLNSRLHAPYMYEFKGELTRHCNNSQVAARWRFTQTVAGISSEAHPGQSPNVGSYTTPANLAGDRRRHSRDRGGTKPRQFNYRTAPAIISAATETTADDVSAPTGAPTTPVDETIDVSAG
jgi:hypothetical protein